jgi:hypothetical protein
MMAATRRDPPQAFATPSGISTATVCRLSGKRATKACLDVETVDASGNVSRRSQVYTEHFVSGSEPIEYCDLHGRFGHGVLGALAAAFGGGRHSDAVPAPMPVATDGAPQPAAVAAVAETATEPATPDGEKPKKRGFWSRIFGGDKKK